MNLRYCGGEFMVILNGNRLLALSRLKFLQAGENHPAQLFG
jgi:hypothetical protein